MAGLFTRPYVRVRAVALAIFAAIALAAVLGYRFSRPSVPAYVASAVPAVADERLPGAPATQPHSRVATPVQSEEDVRREAMVAAYAGLEQDRGDLNSRLGMLNAELWELKLPAEQAAAVTHAMMDAHALLKDPPLLGAFGAPAEIEQERIRVRAAMVGLDEIAHAIHAARPAADGSTGH